MADHDVDLFVIGAGSGGVRAARVASGYGARVMIAEEYRVGGTCVIRGCVPKKLLVYASRFSDEFEDAAGFGWSVGEPTFPLADTARQCRARGDAAGRRLYRHARTLQGRAGQEPRRARGCAYGAALVDRRARARRDHPDRDRRLAALRAEDSRPRTRHLLERGVSSPRAAAANRDPGRRLYRGRIRLHLRRPRQPR